MGIFKKKDNESDQTASAINQPNESQRPKNGSGKDKEKTEKQLISNDELHQSHDNYQEKKLYDNLKQNVEFIKKMEGDSFDLSVREMTLKNEHQEIKIATFFFAGLVDQTFISDTFYESMSNNFCNINDELKTSEEILKYFKDHLLTIAGVDEADTFGKMFNLLLNGDTILLVDNAKSCLIIGSRKMIERGVDKPQVHITVKGSKDAFNENLLTNISLIRRRIRNPNLWAKNYVLGEQSNTNVTVLYLNGVVDEKVLNEVNSRIQRMQADNVLDSAYLKFYLREHQMSLFPVIYDTERPDATAANIMEGRVAILSDGSPFSLLVPTTFLHSIHSMEDYYQKAIFASFFRMIRFISFLIAVFLPAVYLTLVLFHSELLPINFLFSVAGQRVDVPFPGFAEIFIMEMAFDFLREAGLRMPSALGSTLSFVGAIIIGQAAVQAGLISGFVVIVVTVTGLGSLTLTDYDLNMAVTIFRYIIMILATFLGLFGVAIGAVVMFTHLVSMRSFGVSYFVPFAPINAEGLKDSVIRMPLKAINQTKKTPTQKNPY